MENVEERLERSEARTQVCEKEIAENKSMTNTIFKLLLFRMKTEVVEGIENICILGIQEGVKGPNHEVQRLNGSE